MDQFNRFMTGLAADANLGRFVAPLAGQSAEIIVLTLAQALAEAMDSQRGRHTRGETATAPRGEVR